MKRLAYGPLSMFLLAFMLISASLPPISNAQGSRSIQSSLPSKSNEQTNDTIDVSFPTASLAVQNSTYPLNSTFSQGRQALATDSYPSNYTFSNGLTDWTTSNTTKVQVLNDGQGIDGGYLELNGTNQWAQSTAFTVPATTQSLHFDFKTWTNRDATEKAELNVHIYSGSDFTTATKLGTVYGSRNQGWQQARLDVQAFQGQSVKLRFTSDNVGALNAIARIDNATLHVEVPDWTPSKASTVQVISDTTGIDGGYLELNGTNQWAQSTAFTVPATAQSLHFDFKTWTNRDATEKAELNVHIYSGSDFTTATKLGTVYGSRNQGWQQARLDVQAFQGQSVKLRFTSDNVGALNAIARIDNATLHVEVPDWTPSDSQFVNVVDVPAVLNPLRAIPDNESFNTQPVALETSSYPVNYTFSAGRQALATDSYPSNYTFSNGLTDWTTSNTTKVQVLNDGQGIDGGYLELNGTDQWAQSMAFTVPATAQSLHFDFKTWTNRDLTEKVRFYAHIYSGSDFATATNLGTVYGSHERGWQQARLDVQAFQGQSVKLRFTSDNVGALKAIAHIDNATLHVEVPDWTPSKGSTVQVISDTTGIDGGYLELNGINQWAESAIFTVPETAESLQFDYKTWANRDLTEKAALYVHVYTGSSFATATKLATLLGSHEQGWQQATIDISAFRDRIVKLRFTSDDRGSLKGIAHIDNISFVDGSGSPTTGVDPYLAGKSLLLDGTNRSIVSPPITISDTITTVRFDYLTWTNRDALEQVEFKVEALYGANYASSASLGKVYGSENQGWLVGSFNVESYRGQTIKLRFTTDSAGSRNAKTLLGKNALHGTPQLVTKIVKPDSIATDEVGSFQIEYKNIGTGEMDAPLFQLISRGGARIALDEDGLSRGSTILHVLLQVQGAPLDKLPAGSQGSITVYTQASSALDFALTPVPLNVPIPWDTLKPKYFPPDMSQSSFNAYWTALRTMLGETGRELRTNLLAAQHMSITTDAPPSISDVYQTIHMLAEHHSAYGVQVMSLNQMRRQYSSLATDTLPLPPVPAGCAPIPPTMKDYGGEQRQVFINVIGGVRDPSNTPATITDDVSFPRGTFLWDLKASGRIEGQAFPSSGVTISSNEETFVIIHGFTDYGGRNVDANANTWDGDEPSADPQYRPIDWVDDMVVGIHHRKPTANIIVVDWSEAAEAYKTRFQNYFRSRTEAHFVGWAIARQLMQWNISPSELHLFGHSLGAHITSFVADYLDCYQAAKSWRVGQSFEKVRWITGLDPAGPYFATDPAEPNLTDTIYIGDNTGLGGRLEQSDAAFVDVYHTSNFFGNRVGRGHSEFRINLQKDVGGVKGNDFFNQPGCDVNRSYTNPADYVDTCRHMYVVYFYGATIRCDNYTPRSEQRYSIIAGWNTEERPNAAPFSADVRTPATAIARWYEPATNAFKKCDINAIKPLNEDMGELLLGGPELSFPSNLIGPPLASNITSIGNDSGGGPGQGVALGSVQPNQWIVWPEPGSGGWSGSSGTDSGWQTGHPFVAWSIPRN